VARALAADPPVLLMDEPFGAVDPIARERLQMEFLRLQSEVRKTIMFVTHDIEEAVRLGDRIAVFSTGGHLEQYDQPSTVLGNPASPFVADFVGADRGLKQMSVTPIEDSDIDHPLTVGLDDTLTSARERLSRAGQRWAVVLSDDGTLHGWIGAEQAVGPRLVSDQARRMEAWVRRDQSLKDAFAEMLKHDAGWVAVLDDDGRFLGVITPTTLHEGLRRAVLADAKGTRAGDIELDSVSNA
jgi:osmoprotectant transport system ATP-binding protein